MEGINALVLTVKLSSRHLIIHDAPQDLLYDTCIYYSYRNSMHTLYIVERIYILKQHSTDTYQARVYILAMLIRKLMYDTATFRIVAETYVMAEYH